MHHDRELGKDASRMRHIRLILRRLIALSAWLWGGTAWALVDMNNASYSNAFVDVEGIYKESDDALMSTEAMLNRLLGLGVDRAYKSRTLFNGLYGFGWCSTLETRLRFGAGGAVQMNWCGDGAVERYYRAGGDRRAALADALLARLRQEPRTARLVAIIGLDAAAWTQARAALLEHHDLLDRLALHFAIDLRPAPGTVLRREGGGRVELRVEGERIVRRDEDSAFQMIFDLEGRLVGLRHRDSRQVEVVYADGRPLRVTDTQGRWLEFRYTAAGKVSLASQFHDPASTRAYMSEYWYDANGNLVKNRNAWAKKEDEIYRFDYNEFHNLVHITWPDRSSIRLAYDNARDWVTSFRDRDGCIEDYNYAAFDQLHYASFVTKRCDGRVVADNYYEFWHRLGASGSVVLSRVLQRMEGKEREIWYDETFGLPLRIRLDHRMVDYRLSVDGRLASRTLGRQRWDFAAANPGGGVGVVEHELDAQGGSMARRTLPADPWPNIYDPPPAEIGGASAGATADASAGEVPPRVGLLAFHAAWQQLRASERYEQALPLLREHAAGLRSDGSSVAERAQLARMAQILADDLSNTDQAERKALAVELARWVLDEGRALAPVEVARAATSAAKLLREGNAPEAALAVLDEALRILTQRDEGRAGAAGSDGDARGLYLLKSDIFQGQDQPARALAALRQAGGADGVSRDAGRDQRERAAEIYDDAGLAAVALRQYRGSDAALWLALDPRSSWAEREESARAPGRILTRLEDLMAELGRYGDALFVNDLQLQRLPAPAAVATTEAASARVLARRALWLTFAGRYAEALDVADQAVAEAGRDADALAQAWGARATLASRLGEPGEAVELLQRAASLGPAHSASKIGNLASGLGDAGRYDEAELRFREALALDLTRLPADHPSIANLRSLWAAMQLRSGEPARAAALLDEAVPSLLDAYGNGHWRTARALGLRSAAALQQGDAAAALIWAQRAVDAAQQSGHAEWQPLADHALASALAANAQPVLAVFFAKRAVSGLQGLRAQDAKLPAAWQRSFVRSRSAVYETAASLLVDAGRLAEAQQVLAMFKESELQEFTRRDGSADPRTTRIEMGGAEARWNAELEKAAGSAGEVGRELAELDALRRLGALNATQAARRTELRAAVDVAQQRFAAALDSIRAEAQTESADATRAAEDAAKRADPTLRDLVERVSQQSGSRTVALQYLMTERKLHILVTTPDLQFAREVPIGRATLNRAVQDFRDVLQNPRADPLPAAQLLWRYLIAPVVDDLDRLRAQTLMVSLTGALRYAPLAALHDGRGYLVHRFRVALMTEATLTLGMGRPSAQWTVGALGVSARVHPQFEALPAVRDELQRIVRNAQTPQGVLPGQSHLDAAFTADRLREVLDDKPTPTVVHLASHFKFTQGSDLGSFLLLGDGQQLSLRELLSSAYRFRGVELLTLSACDTAVGGGVDEAGREVEGLAAQAQKQGALAVLATLWSVADSSTGQLMQRFYELRQSGGNVSKAEALHLAQIEMLHGTAPARADAVPPADGRGAKAVWQGSPNVERRIFEVSARAPFAHPFFWAPFVLIGNWL